MAEEYPFSETTMSTQFDSVDDAIAAIAAGADGLIVEVHPTPERALSDGDQSLALEEFAELMQRLAPFAEAAGRTVAQPVTAVQEAS
jgi:3-deoxy-D-arabino-heptulosonate 7-phosphate (DAHP) synthase